MIARHASATVTTATNISTLARAESVYVKCRGEVDLKSFNCTDVTRSSFINRVCYDEANDYMLIKLNGTYYHYCAIDGDTVSALLAADSMGRFYNASIKGKFDCRVHRVPEYPHDGGVTTKSDDVSAPPQANPPSRDDLSAAPTPDANTPAAIPSGAKPTMNARESGPFDGRWPASVGPQGGCNFTSILILDVVGSSIVGNATNPLGVFPLATVDPSGRGIFKIGRFAGTIRFSGTKFEANYANDCGGRFAVGLKRTAQNLN
jgi:hypothetical protein